MYTKCTHCQSLFEVQAQILRAGQGMVRCGHCKQIFNAMLNLMDAQAASRKPDGVALLTQNPLYAPAPPASSHNVMPGVAAHAQMTLSQPRPMAPPQHHFDEDFLDDAPTRRNAAMETIQIVGEASKSALTFVKSKSSETVNWFKKTPKNIKVRGLKSEARRMSWRERFSQFSERLAYRLASFHRSMLSEFEEDARELLRKRADPHKLLQSPSQPAANIDWTVSPRNSHTDPKNYASIGFMQQEFPVDNNPHREIDSPPKPEPSHKMPRQNAAPKETPRTRQGGVPASNRTVDPLDQLQIFDDMDDAKFEEHLWLDYFANENQSLGTNPAPPADHDTRTERSEHAEQKEYKDPAERRERTEKDIPHLGVKPQQINNIPHYEAKPRLHDDSDKYGFAVDWENTSSPPSPAPSNHPAMPSATAQNIPAFQPSSEHPQTVYDFESMDFEAQDTPAVYAPQTHQPPQVTQPDQASQGVRRAPQTQRPALPPATHRQSAPQQTYRVNQAPAIRATHPTRDNRSSQLPPGNRTIHLPQSDLPQDAPPVNRQFLLPHGEIPPTVDRVTPPPQISRSVLPSQAQQPKPSPNQTSRPPQASLPYAPQTRRPNPPPLHPPKLRDTPPTPAVVAPTHDEQETFTAREPLETLRELYQNVKNPFLRAAAVRGLQDHALLTEIALHDATVIVRIAAVEKLDDAGVLLEILETDNNEELQKSVIRRLKRLEMQRRS